MARKTTADDFVKDNEEYVKLRGQRSDEQPHREQPARQGPGGRGHDRPSLEAWTTPELRAHALRLGIPDASELHRDPLIDAILGRQASRGG